MRFLSNNKASRALTIYFLIFCFLATSNAVANPAFIQEETISPKKQTTKEEFLSELKLVESDLTQSRKRGEKDILISGLVERSRKIVGAKAASLGEVTPPEEIPLLHPANLEEIKERLEKELEGYLKPTFSIAPDIPETIWLGLYSGHLRAVLNELLKNSREAGATQVNLNFQMIDGKLIIKAQDNGEGVSYESLKKALLKAAQEERVIRNEDGILEVPFPRIADAKQILTTEEVLEFIKENEKLLPFISGLSVKGSFRGMGIAASWQIIKRHGGTMDYTTGPEGTTFTIQSPVSVKAKSLGSDFVIDSGRSYSFKDVEIEQRQYPVSSPASVVFPTVILEINNRAYEVGGENFLVITLANGKKIYWGGQHNLSYSFFFENFKEKAAELIEAGGVLWFHIDNHVDLGSYEEANRRSLDTGVWQKEIEHGYAHLSFANYMGYLLQTKVVSDLHRASSLEEIVEGKWAIDSPSVVDFDVDVILDNTGKTRLGLLEKAKLLSIFNQADVVFMTNSSELSAFNLGVPLHIDPHLAISTNAKFIQELALQSSLVAGKSLGKEEKKEISFSEINWNPFRKYGDWAGFFRGRTINQELDDIQEKAMAHLTMMYETALKEAKSFEMEELLEVAKDSARAKIEGMIAVRREGALENRLMDFVLRLNGSGVTLQTRELVKNYLKDFWDKASGVLSGREVFELEAQNAIRKASRLKVFRPIRTILVAEDEEVYLKDYKKVFERLGRDDIDVLYFPTRKKAITHLKTFGKEVDLIFADRSMVDEEEYKERLVAGLPADVDDGGLLIEEVRNKLNLKTPVVFVSGSRYGQNELDQFGNATQFSKAYLNPEHLGRLVQELIKILPEIPEPPDVEGLMSADKIKTHNDYLLDLLSFLGSLDRSEITTKINENLSPASWQAWVAHDFKTPIGVILQNVQLIEDYKKSDEAVPIKNIKRIIENYQKIKDALTVIDRAGEPIRPEYFDRLTHTGSKKDPIPYGDLTPHLVKRLFYDHPGAENNLAMFQATVPVVESAIEKLGEVIDEYAEEVTAKSLGELEKLAESIWPGNLLSKEEMEVAGMPFAVIRGKNYWILGDYLFINEEEWTAHKEELKEFKDSVVVAALTRGVLSEALDFYYNVHTRLAILLLQARSDLIKDKTVLDAGAGDSVLGAVASRLGAKKVIEIEKSGEWAAEARKLAKINEIENVEILEKDFSELEGLSAISNIDIVLASLNSNGVFQEENYIKNWHFLISDLINPDWYFFLGGVVEYSGAAQWVYDVMTQEKWQATVEARGSEGVRRTPVAHVFQNITKGKSLGEDETRREGRAYIKRLAGTVPFFIETKGEMISRLYQNTTSDEAKRMLLRPDVLPVLFGIKPAYIAYTGEPMPDPLSEEVFKMPEVRESLGLLFAGNFILSVRQVFNRLEQEGDFLVTHKIISKNELNSFVRNGPTPESLRAITDILRQYHANIPGRHILQGFILGYPLEEIVLAENTRGKKDEFLSQGGIVYEGDYGSFVMTKGSREAAELLLLWDTTAHYGYTVLSGEPDFEEMMDPDTLKTFKEIEGKSLGEELVLQWAQNIFGGKVIQGDDEAYRLFPSTSSSYIPNVVGIRLQKMDDPSNVSMRSVMTLALINSDGSAVKIGGFDFDKVTFKGPVKAMDLRGQKLGSQMMKILGDGLEKDALVIVDVRQKETNEKLYREYYVDRSGVLRRKADGLIMVDGKAAKGEISFEKVFSETLWGKLLRKAGLGNFQILTSGRLLKGVEALKYLLKNPEFPKANLKSPTYFIGAKKMTPATGKSLGAEERAEAMRQEAIDRTRKVLEITGKSLGEIPAEEGTAFERAGRHIRFIRNMLLAIRTLDSGSKLYYESLDKEGNKIGVEEILWDDWAVHTVLSYMSGLKRQYSFYEEHPEKIKIDLRKGSETFDLIEEFASFFKDNFPPIKSLAEKDPSEYAGNLPKKGDEADPVDYNQLGRYFARDLFINHPEAEDNWRIFQVAVTRINETLPKLESAIRELGEEPVAGKSLGEEEFRAFYKDKLVRISGEDGIGEVVGVLPAYQIVRVSHPSWSAPQQFTDDELSRIEVLSEEEVRRIKEDERRAEREFENKYYEKYVTVDGRDGIWLVTQIIPSVLSLKLEAFHKSDVIFIMEEELEQVRVLDDQEKAEQEFKAQKKPVRAKQPKKIPQKPKPKVKRPEEKKAIKTKKKKLDFATRKLLSLAILEGARGLAENSIQQQLSKLPLKVISDINFKIRQIESDEVRPPLNPFSLESWADSFPAPKKAFLYIEKVLQLKEVREEFARDQRSPSVAGKSLGEDREVILKNILETVSGEMVSGRDENYSLHLMTTDFISQRTGWKTTNVRFYLQKEKDSNLVSKRAILTLIFPITNLSKPIDLYEIKLNYVDFEDGAGEQNLSEQGIGVQLLKLVTEALPVGTRVAMTILNESTREELLKMLKVDQGRVITADNLLVVESDAGEGEILFQDVFSKTTMGKLVGRAGFKDIRIIGIRYGQEGGMEGLRLILESPIKSDDGQRRMVNHFLIEMFASGKEPVTAKSLGEGEDTEIVQRVVTNIEESTTPFYGLLPASFINNFVKSFGKEVFNKQAELILGNRTNNLIILWDIDISETDKMDWLENNGLSKYIGKKNLITTSLKRGLKETNELSAKVDIIRQVLSSRGVDSNAVGLLKPVASEFKTPVLSLKSVSPNALALLHYLIQIDGDLSQDLLRIFKVDPKTGDFIAELPEYLEELFRQYEAQVEIARAA